MKGKQRQQQENRQKVAQLMEKFPVVSRDSRNSRFPLLLFFGLQVKTSVSASFAHNEPNFWSISGPTELSLWARTSSAKTWPK